MNTIHLSLNAGTRQLRLTDRDLDDIERLLNLLGSASGEQRAGECESAALRELAVRIYSARALRDEYLPAAIFGEAAWDILLGLYALGDGVGGGHMACEGLLKPNSTLRWIDYLEEEGLVEREPAQRGAIMKLTARGRVAIEGYLKRLSSRSQ
jgi:DNA-binding MarR family transcriptional regulator